MFFELKKGSLVSNKRRDKVFENKKGLLVSPKKEGKKKASVSFLKRRAY